MELDELPHRRPLPTLPPLNQPGKTKLVPLETQQSSHPESNDVYKKPRRKKKRRRPKPEVIENPDTSVEVLDDSVASNKVQTFETEKVENKNNNARSRRRTRNSNRHAPSEEVSMNEVPIPSARKSSGARRSRDQFNHSLEPIINEEDVVVNRHIAEGRSVKEVKQQAASTKTGKVYIQTQNGFKGHTTEWLQQRRKMEESEAGYDVIMEARINKSCLIATSIQLGFDKFAYLMHSLLAGISLWHIFYIFVLRAKGVDNFFEQYEQVAIGVGLAFQVVLLLCFISALDKFDLGGNGLLIFPQLMKGDPKAWVVVVNFLAVVFEYSTTNLTVWIGTNNPTLQSGDNLFNNNTFTSNFLNEDPEKNFTTWLVLNCIRTVFTLFGWLLLSSDHKSNNTIKNLFPNLRKSSNAVDAVESNS